MLSRLYTANNGILRQKRGLIQKLVSRFGEEEAKELYKKTCPVVGASIGQHIRHSNDHIEKALYATSHPETIKIQYDIRKRGCPDENDMIAAGERIERVIQMLREIGDSQEYIPVIDHRIQACFMLSGDDEHEFPLPSTAARELGFAAHHAIHHLALVRIIALHTLKLPESDLPSDFGKAPSTVNFERHE